MSISSRLALALVLVTGSAFVSYAHTTTYTAILSGPLQSPANASPGIGFATVTLDMDLVTMEVDLTFSGLQGTATAAHIHGATAAPFTGTAIVAVALFGEVPRPVFTGANAPRHTRRRVKLTDAELRLLEQASLSVEQESLEPAAELL